jgi:hypothetical protein
MSSNVIYLPGSDTPMSSITSLENKGIGDDSGRMDTLEPRVTKLEADVSEIKATLGRMEPLLIRIETQGQKTAVELAELRGIATGLKDHANGLPKSADLMRIIFWVVGINALATFGSALPTFFKH